MLICGLGQGTVEPSVGQNHPWKWASGVDFLEEIRGGQMFHINLCSPSMQVLWTWSGCTVGLDKFVKKHMFLYILGEKLCENVVVWGLESSKTWKTYTQQQVRVQK